MPFADLRFWYPLSMPRRARVAPGGYVYHVLNRSAGRFKMFRTDADYEAFMRVLRLAREKCPLRILSYCVLATHWHFVVWPMKDGELTDFFRWLAHTHAMRWRVAHHTVGWGHLYQGRFKSFPVQTDEHFLTVCRYVERNALSAGVVKHAQDWKWSSLWVRENGTDEQKQILSEWPVPRRSDWIDWVNAPISAKEQQKLDLSLERGRPYGDEPWVERIVNRFDLQHTLRREGRPLKEGSEESKSKETGTQLVKN